MELVGCSDELFAGELRDCFCHLFGKTRRGIQTGTNGSAAQGQLLQVGEGIFQHGFIFFQAGTPAGDFLGKADGGSILQMVLPDLTMP